MKAIGNHELGFAFPLDIQDRLRILDAGRHRLFQKNMHIGFERTDDQIGVVGVRRSHVDGIDLA